MLAQELAEQLKVVLKRHGYSLTVQRQIVFAALQEQEPQTMHELVRRCNAIDRASVYRAIALFEQLGIVQRLQLGWKYKLELTDAFAHHHHHFSCVRCGSVQALPEDAVLEKRLATLARAQGVVAQDHQVEIRGLCERCKIVTSEAS